MYKQDEDFIYLKQNPEQQINWMNNVYDPAMAMENKINPYFKNENRNCDQIRDQFERYYCHYYKTKYAANKRRERNLN